MTPTDYQPITPANIYAGLAEPVSDSSRNHVSSIIAHQPSGNSYMDLFAEQIRQYGKRSSKWYARQMNADARQFDGAIRCMSGLSAHDWICDYLRLVACDLLKQTDWTFKEIGLFLRMSSSSFSQFFRAYEGMQPWEYRSLKKKGARQNYFYY